MKKRLEEKGFAVTLSCMSEFRTNNLKKIKQLLIVVSTYGEGDPPDKAVLFHEFVHGKRAPRLEGVRFSVLSLGDQLYDQFCKTGKDFDARLEELRAKRIHPRVDCNVDFDEPANAWMEGVLDALAVTTRSQQRYSRRGWRCGRTDRCRRPRRRPLEARAASGRTARAQTVAAPAFTPHESFYFRGPGELQSQRPRIGKGNPPPEAGHRRLGLSRAGRLAGHLAAQRPATGQPGDRPHGLESAGGHSRRQA